ncbi:Adult-specific cuticular protein ACP-20 [Papilio xuthus]|uniref:Adult-specific cuticular protein ACP-20 n=1 Tax=Papilio xuthus TaxID=66420 RepID=A0A194QER3_PAPXU|nr:Adult-specific cuticular protein ACP-20 [Papilio xuthus]
MKTGRAYIRHTLSLTALAVAFVSGAVVSRKTLVSEYDYPRYGFNYAINDPITKDNKAQWEARDGDVVNGAYSLREPDGTIRVVEYSANDLKGFNAVVKKIGNNVHPITIITKTSHGTVPIKSKAPVKVVPVVDITPVSISTVTNSGPKNSIISSFNYGFGAAPLAIGLPKVTSLGHWSLPWDPVTRSYGGWVPLNGPVAQGPYATVFSKKYINGKLHEWTTGPISLQNVKTLVIKKKN